jgi:hypothetical protein
MVHGMVLDASLLHQALCQGAMHLCMANMLICIPYYGHGIAGYVAGTWHDVGACLLCVRRMGLGGAARARSISLPLALIPF